MMWVGSYHRGGFDSVVCLLEVQKALKSDTPAFRPISCTHHKYHVRLSSDRAETCTASPVAVGWLSSNR